MIHILNAEKSELLRDSRFNNGIHLSIDSVWLIGTRGAYSKKAPREDSDFDIVISLGNKSESLILENLANLPQAIKDKKTGDPVSHSFDSWGQTFWESIGGQKTVDYLNQMGREALAKNGFANIRSTEVDIFITSENANGNCVRLAWQIIVADDGDSIEWEGLGYIHLGEDWKTAPRHLLD